MVFIKISLYEFTLKGEPLSHSRLDIQNLSQRYYLVVGEGTFSHPYRTVYRTIIYCKQRYYLVVGEGTFFHPYRTVQSTEHLYIENKNVTW